MGLALVVTQRGQSVYLHTHGDLKKITACKVKPNKLVSTDKDTNDIKEVMKEDGLEDINNLYTMDLNDFYYNNKHIDEKLNTAEEYMYNVKYTNTHNNVEDIVDATEITESLVTPRYVSFKDACTYTVELPISEHWRPEVKVAKKAEVKNLQDYETFMEVKDKGQTKVGS